jgi:hypothetical protein
MTKHGLSVGLTARAYKLWLAINQRCKENPAYIRKKITVCPEWSDFHQFRKDMGDPPKGLEIDRIDNNQGYSKDNCRWVTRRENQRNRSDNVWITFQGRTLCFQDWAKKVGINPGTLYDRLKSGWPIDRALTEPAHKGKNQYSCP